MHTPSDETELEYQSAESPWIAIQPPVLARINDQRYPLDAPPPSFESAQHDVVLRRQRQRPRAGGGLKSTAVPSRFLNLPSTFGFSGWGTRSRITLEPTELSRGEEDIQRARRAVSLGQFTASALAGNAVLGSVFYALPAVVLVSGVYSPISLFVASCVMFLWRPIMEEVASALPISGAPYTYLLNVSSKSLALIGASLLLLDFAATSVVSAATAVSYLAGEVTLPFPVVVGALIILLIFLLISLSGTRDSARLALTLLSIHVITMTVLFIASIIAWAKRGNTQIKENWEEGRMNFSTQPTARQIFNGVCIGVLGLTGFECVPSYAACIKPGRFRLVLRNLHFPAIILNTFSMLFVLAHVPLPTVLGGANVLSVLAQTVAGRWLRVWVVVDAVITLCGGVLTGILGACELFDRLARDRLLPQLFTRRLPVTHSPAYSIVAFVAFSFVVYATSGANLGVTSKMFSLVWLAVMTLFPISALLLKFNRGRLTRTPHTPLLLVLFTLAVGAVIIGGNIAIDPSIVGYAAAYVLVIAAVFFFTMEKVRVLHALLWAYDQYSVLSRLPWTRSWGTTLTAAMRHLRTQPVCVLVRTDEINVLFHKLLYVSQNEETSCLKLVHFYDDELGIPSEMDANWKILDEAFPEITVDLILVQGAFTPSNVAALGHRLGIPTTLMFMSCPGPDFPFSIADFGTRIVSM